MATNHQLTDRATEFWHGTGGPGSRAAGLAMAYKLLQAAQDRWRAVNGPHLVALVRAGATFHKGQLVERPTEITKNIRKRAPKKTPSTVQERVAA